jgi:hypothetical protein
VDSPVLAAASLREMHMPRYLADGRVTSVLLVESTYLRLDQVAVSE